MKKTLIILPLLIVIQSANASLWDDTIDWLNSLWVINEVEVVDALDNSSEFTFELVDMDGVVHSQNETKGKAAPDQKRKENNNFLSLFCRKTYKNPEHRPGGAQ